MSPRPPASCSSDRPTPEAPRRDPAAQAVALPDGRVLVRHRGGVSLLRGVAVEDLRRVLARLDGRRSAAQIAAELSGEYEPEQVRRLLENLSGEMVLPARRAGKARPGAEARSGTSADLAAPVAIFANGPAGRRAAQALRRAGLTGTYLAEVASFLSCRSPEFLAGEERALPPAGRLAPDRTPGEALRGDPRIEAADRSLLAGLLAGAALAVGVLEEVPYQALFEVQGACREVGVPALFLVADPDGVRLGPTVLPGSGPCLACLLLSGLGSLGLPATDLLSSLAHFRTGRLPASHAGRAAAAAAEEARALLGGGGEPSLPGEVLLFAAAGGSRRVSVERVPGCPVCDGSMARAALAGRSEDKAAPASPAVGWSEQRVEGSSRDGAEKPGIPAVLPVSSLALAPVLAPVPGAPAQAPSSPAPAASRAAQRAGRVLVEALDRRPPRASPAGDDQVSSVLILGGGTAGYLAALALRAKLPHLAVTLVESPDVPVIGVGEATTPLMPQFLHVDLGLDAAQLFREVQPTFKLGIRFLWGEPGHGDFHYPFGPLHVVEPRVHGGDLRDCSLQGMLMTAGAVPVYSGEGAEGEWTCRLGTEVAYHLDNQRFVAYLQRRAAERGIERVEANIAQVELSPDGPDGEEVRSLLAADGRRFAADLFLDCTGFRAMLIEGALGSPWISFAESLFTDRAVVAPVPHGGAVRPYTTAETMRCGWCWSTPQEDADHRGYVFASAWLGDAEAEAEMRRANPGMGEARIVRFRAGRHAHFFKGNVVALGNSYGFVEPLESTALHMLVRQIGLLVRSFPLRRGERGLKALLDRKAGAWWDYLRWFLALHYRFNRRLDTPFWRACREEVDVGSHGELLAAFRERGPLSYDPAARGAFDYPDPLWGPEGIDVLLLGQGVPAPLPRPALGAAAWQERLRLARELVARAAPHERALALLAERPGLVARLEDAFRAAGPAFPVAPR